MIHDDCDAYETGMQLVSLVSFCFVSAQFCSVRSFSYDISWCHIALKSKRFQFNREKRSIVSN